MTTAMKKKVQDRTMTYGQTVHNIRITTTTHIDPKKQITVVEVECRYCGLYHPRARLETPFGQPRVSNWEEKLIGEALKAERLNGGD